MNTGLVLKQEELVSVLNAGSHTLPAAVPQVRARFGLILIVCQVLTLQRGVTGTARMLHALTHSSISRQVREQM